MSETVGAIETRSRSRSKTPGLLQENGDSNKGAKKIPTISLIEEEEESSQPLSQRPKRQRRSAKNTQSDTSNEIQSDVAVVSNNKQVKASTTTTTTTTILTTKQIINGSEEKSEEKTTKTTTVSNDAQENADSQSIFNNIFNAIKTSTPIISNKRTKQRIIHESNSSQDIDYKLHPAYKEYKDAGEYWNKYPKTDYTYSELSPHRRELGSGIVAMPNMSRKSLDKYTNRIEAMIQQNPSEESFIRRKFLSNMSYQKKSSDLQYDSADEVDVSILHQKLSARQYSQKNVFYRLYLFVVGFFSSAYSNVKQRIWYNNKYAKYTPIKRHHQQQGLAQRLYSSVQKFILLCISKVYLFISTILCLDTWLLYTRSENVRENRKRKNFLLGLLILFPLMLFGAFLLSDDTYDATALFTKINISPLKAYHRHVASISQYLNGISIPAIALPQINLDFGFLLMPLYSLGAILREFISSSKSGTENLKYALDEDKFQMLLKHIDITIDEKFKVYDSVMMKEVNDRFIVLIGTNVKDALNHYKYELSAGDLEMIINQIKVQLQKDFSDNEKSILAKIALANDENVEKIKLAASMSSQSRDVKLENENIDVDKIILMILKSNKLSSYLETHLGSIKVQLGQHHKDIEDLKKEIGQIKLDIVNEFKNYDENLMKLKMEGRSMSDDLIKFKKENDEAIKSLLGKIDGRFSEFSSIDASVRKSLLNILGLSSSDVTDEESLKQWIENTFIAKIYLEEHLKGLELRLNDAFLAAIDKNSGILMEEINEKLKLQAKLKIEQNKLSGSLNEDEIIRIVKGVLAVYDADKTGLVDYALESAGGQIISTRCTENYRTKSAEISIFGIPLWYPTNTPRTVISPTISPGECWAFQGFPGYLVIKLNNFIRVTGFTIEHIPQSNAPNGIIDSAPNNFTVWGLTSELDKNPVQFGSYFYSAEKNAPSLQYFPVQNREITSSYQFVELVIESNHGNLRYTCLYRFRVHGDMN